MTTTLFSFQRLWRLIYKQGAENARFYKLAIPAVTGLLTLVYVLFLFALNRKLPDAYHSTIFLSGIYISGIALASTSFQQMHHKNTGVYWISLPATALEKLLCILFYNTLVFTLAYAGCFYLVKGVIQPFTLPYVSFPYETEPIYGGIFKGMGMTADRMTLLLAFFPIQTFFITGSAWCKKNAFINTTIAIALLFFLTILYLQGLTKLVLGKGYSWFGSKVTYYTDATYSAHREYSLPEWVFATIRGLLLYGLLICFWAITWFRLKEKQL